MNRVCGRVLAGLALVFGGAMVGPACSHDDTTIFIRDVLYPTPVAAGQACMFTSDPTQPYLTVGTLDIGLRPIYAPIFLLGNQMVPEVNPSTPSTETSFVTIQGAVVRVTDSSGVQIDTFTTLTGTTIPPSTGTTPGYASMGVTIVDTVDPTVGTFFDPVRAGGSVRVITYTRFFGKTLGGLSVESNEFEFPVDVCFGCLINFPANETNPSLPQPNCNLAGAASGTTTTTTTTPCSPGQDTPEDCSLCSEFPACQGKLAGVTLVDAGIADAGGGG